MDSIHRRILYLRYKPGIAAILPMMVLFVLAAWLVEPALALSPHDLHFPQSTSETHFAYGEIRLWPEFDQPSMLVMYTFVLTQSTPIPAQMAIRIPTSAGIPESVSVGPDPENIFDVEYTRQVEGQWSTLRFNTALPVIRIEYYDPTITKNGKIRHYNYSWTADYPIDTLILQIQKPYGSKNVQISPAISNSEWASDGVLNYYSADVTNLANGKAFSIDLSYQKENDLLSVPGLEVRSTVPITYRTQGRVRWWSTFPWLLFVPFFAILLIVTVLLYFRFNPRKLIPVQVEMTRSSKTDNSPPTPPDIPVWVTHCQQCGRRANPGDRFCRTCGALLRNIG